VLVKGFLDDMLGSSFADMIGFKKGVHRVCGLHHLNVSDKVAGPALGREATDGEAHDARRLCDEGVDPALRTPRADDRIARQGFEELTDLDASLDDRERTRSHHDDVHSGGVST
jgi:hypothetical protein